MDQEALIKELRDEIAELKTRLSRYEANGLDPQAQRYLEISQNIIKIEEFIEEWEIALSRFPDYPTAYSGVSPIGGYLDLQKYPISEEEYRDFKNTIESFYKDLEG